MDPMGKGGQNSVPFNKHMEKTPTEPSSKIGGPPWFEDVLLQVILVLHPRLVQEKLCIIGL